MTVVLIFTPMGIVPALVTLKQQEIQTMPKTMFEKIWDSHIVRDVPGESAVLYIDRHLVHEVTSPQAFASLKVSGRAVRNPEATIAVLDHNIPTIPGRRMLDVVDPALHESITTLAHNVHEYGITFFDMANAKQGIVHVIGPELGITLPGMTLVCGDSHTSTHGAMGALAFGIGTSEVEHVLATQCLPQKKPKTMQIHVSGKLAEGVTAKDLALGIIGRIGTDGATGHVIEYAGDAVRALSMEGRMTLCNMSIEAGAPAGLIAPDDTNFASVRGRRFAPKGKDWEEAGEYWGA